MRHTSYLGTLIRTTYKYNPFGQNTRAVIPAKAGIQPTPLWIPLPRKGRKDALLVCGPRIGGSSAYFRWLTDCSHRAARRPVQFPVDNGTPFIVLPFTPGQCQFDFGNVFFYIETQGD